jgi:predicted nucleic acid-binding protein
VTAYLVDTSALLAVIDERERWHAATAAVLRQPRHEFHGPAVILGETYTFARRRHGFGVARQAVRTLSGGRITWHEMSSARDEATWRVIDEFAGVPLSYPDAAIVALSRELGIGAVFGIDDDLRLAGLQLVPG